MTTKLRAASFQDGAVTTAKIAADAVTTAKIAGDAVTAAKIPANAIGSSELDLTASYAFTGTISGAGAMVKVSSVTSIATDLTSLEITLPTTTDFRALLLYINLRGETASDAYWQATMRNAAGSAYLGGSTDYSYLAHNLHSNNSSTGNDVFQAQNGTTNIRFQNGYTGDGSDDYETGFAEILMTNTQGTSRFPRIGWKWHLEKRHNDAYTYQHHGSAILKQSVEVDRIKIVKSDGAEFSNYGYTLYKVMN